MKNLGVVIVEVPFGMSLQETRAMVAKGAALVPDGRLLAVCYEMNPEFGASLPVESAVVSEVMGTPHDRTGESGWLFFGNLAIRVCTVRSGDRKILRELGVVLMCREGDKAYVRRKTASPELLSSSAVPGLHPVFTRDVANNVWHIPAVRYRSRIRSRLSSLMAWSDEEVLLVGPKGSRRLAVIPMDLDDDLVGVPTKQPYTWDQ